MEPQSPLQITKEAIQHAKISKKKEKLILEQVREKLERERTMKLSVKEGAAASVMTGFGTDYITPYALALGSNNAQIGLLSSLSGIISPTSQILGSRLMERYSRKKIIFNFVALQALMWLPIMLLSLFLWKNIFVSYLPVILIIFYTLFAILGAIAGPSWFSLMGDIVPGKIRGRYFGNRNKICGAVAMLSTILAAFLLDFFKTRGLILVGFSILFFLACVFRLISGSLFRKHYEPRLKFEKGYYFSIWQFIKKAPKNNFGKFVFFVALMHLAVNIAGPFFAVYMLKDLGFSYTTYMLVNVSAAIFSLLFMPIWGKFSDKYGNREMIKIGSVLVIFIPLLWIISSSPLYLMIIPQIVSGIGWAAFNLATSNFIYDSVSPQRRGLCVSYFNIIAGAGVFIGAGVGGLLAQYLSISFMNKLLFLFLISSIARFLVFLFMLPLVKEVKKVTKPKSAMLYFREVNPARGIANELVQDIVRIKDGISRKKKK